MLKVLVTGSNGQLGKEFKKNISFNSLFETNYCSKEECDISDFIKTEKILRTYKPNILINCAAYTNVDKAEIHKNEANIINNLAVENLAKLSKILNITLIHFSTDYVFGKCINRPFKEYDKKNPIKFLIFMAILSPISFWYVNKHGNTNAKSNIDNTEII